MLISGLISDRPIARLVIKLGAVMAYFETIWLASLVACV